MRRRKTHLGMAIFLSAAAIIAGCVPSPSHTAMLRWISQLPTKSLSDYRFDPTMPLMVLNPDTMRHDISEWMTYHESTAFVSKSACESEIRGESTAAIPTGG